MILIPEKELVVILVPRTASGTLRRAILSKYPMAMQVYRHMEADGVPAGYDWWPKVGIVRHPVDRLWSLYKFLKHFDGAHDHDYIDAMRKSVEMPFSDWLLRNDTVFTSPHDRADRGRFWPQYNVRHALPENRKSQFMYLRPDLGTEVYPYKSIASLCCRLGLEHLQQHNTTDDTQPPALSSDAASYVERVFSWDLANA